MPKYQRLGNPLAETMAAYLGYSLPDDIYVLALIDPKSSKPFRYFDRGEFSDVDRLYFFLRCYEIEMLARANPIAEHILKTLASSGFKDFVHEYSQLSNWDYTPLDHIRKKITTQQDNAPLTKNPEQLDTTYAGRAAFINNFIDLFQHQYFKEEHVDALLVYIQRLKLSSHASSKSTVICLRLLGFAHAWFARPGDKDHSSFLYKQEQDRKALISRAKAIIVKNKDANEICLKSQKNLLDDINFYLQHLARYEADTEIFAKKDFEKEIKQSGTFPELSLKQHLQIIKNNLTPCFTVEEEIVPKEMSPSSQEEDAKREDAINRKKLHDILSLISNHRFVLHSGIQVWNKNKYPTGINKVVTLITNFFAENSEVLTTQKLSQLFKEIINELESKTTSSYGFFGLGARDQSTAELNKRIIDFCSLGEAQRNPGYPNKP